MLRTLRPIVSLLAATALLLAAVGLLNTLIPLRALHAGFSNALLGGLTSAFYAGYLAGTVAMPLLIRRIGHIRAFAFGTACTTCVVLLHVFGTWPWVWLLLRFAAGVMLVGLYSIIESWLNAQAPSGQRGRVFASYMVVNLCALALAQQFLRIGGQPFLLFTVVALLACFAAVPIVVTHLAQPLAQSSPRLNLKRLYAVAPSAGIGALLSGLAMGAFYGFAPVYAQRLGFGTATISVYMSAGILGGAALQWPVGRLSDRFDRRLVLAVVSLLAGVLGLLVWTVGGREQLAIAMIFLYGGMAFAVYPLVVAHLVDSLTHEELLGASSTALLVYGAGSAAGPLIVGFGIDRLGSGMLPLWFAAVHGVLAVYAWYCYRTVWRPDARKRKFMLMLRTTPAALDMLVRSRRRGKNKVPPAA